MQLDDLLSRYFYDTDVSSVTPDTLATGIERCLVDLGLEQDRGKRSLYWPCSTCLGQPLTSMWRSKIMMTVRQPVISWTFSRVAKAMRKGEDTLDLRVTFMPNRTPLRLSLRTCLNQVS